MKGHKLIGYVACLLFVLSPDISIAQSMPRVATIKGHVKTNGKPIQADSVRKAIAQSIKGAYKDNGMPPSRKECGELCVEFSINHVKGVVLPHGATQERHEIKVKFKPFPRSDDGMLEVHLSLEGWYKPDKDAGEERSLGEDHYEKLHKHGKKLLHSLIGYLEKRLSDA